MKTLWVFARSSGRTVSNFTMRFLLIFQNIVIAISLLLLAFIPIAIQIFGYGFDFKGALYLISLSVVVFVMIIRPLADVTGWLWLRRLVILRKGFGILSASIIVGLLINTLVTPESTYLSSLLTPAYFSLNRLVLFAHMGDWSGLILLLTSNTFSQRVLKRNWKRIQRLSYVYFYAGAIYEAFTIGSLFALYTLLVVTNLTALAWAVNRLRRAESAVVSGALVGA